MAVVAVYVVAVVVCGGACACMDEENIGGPDSLQLPYLLE